MELFYNSNCMQVKSYIRKNYYKLTKHQLIAFITKHTRLKESTAIKMYEEIEFEKFIEKRDKGIEEKEIKYKGRKRNFFEIDDSLLWRSIYE